MGKCNKWGHTNRNKYMDKTRTHTEDGLETLQIRNSLWSCSVSYSIINWA
jgi:hypothetical protein